MKMTRQNGRKTKNVTGNLLDKQQNVYLSLVKENDVLLFTYLLSKENTVLHFNCLL